MLGDGVSNGNGGIRTIAGMHFHDPNGKDVEVQLVAIGTSRKRDVQFILKKSGNREAVRVAQ